MLNSPLIAPEMRNYPTLGFEVALRCVCDFGWTGRGTPAPFAPPQRLVVVGLYQYVRNPMYVGFAMGWIGLWVVFEHAVLAWQLLRSECICSCSFGKNRRCAGSWGRTTRNTAGM